MRRPILLSIFASGIALAFVMLLTFSVSATMWTDPFRVSDLAKRPAAAIDSTGEMYFVWANPNRNVLQYRHCAAPDTCDAIEQLPKLTGAARAPALALDSQQRPHVVWEQVAAKKHTVYFSRRDAGTWSDPIALSDQPRSIQPALALDADDAAHVVYESIQQNGRAIYYVTQSSNQAPRPPRLLDLETVDDSEKIAGGRNARIAVDGNKRAHVVWNLVRRPFGVKYTFQDANGDFGAPQVIADGGRAQTPDISIDRETNRVGIVWEARKSNRAAFVLLENGVEIFRKKNVGPEVARRPRLAADCGGRFHIVYQRAKTLKDEWDIFYRQFDPTNNSFSAPLRLSPSKKNDIQPTIAANKAGIVAFVTGKGGVLNARQADIEGICYGDPTPTPTLTPTVPTTGWEHIPNHDGRIVYVNAWKTVDAAKASDGNFARCETDGKCKKDSSAKLEFTGGMRIEWETAYANTYGRADVLIDDKVFERVDLCKLNQKSSKPKFAKRTYILSGDATTAHSIEIKFIGHSNCSAVKKNYVAIDGFNILR